jgi:predicted phage tail component-like protein
MSNRYGLTFKNSHSFKVHGLILQSIDRSLLPTVKRQQVNILSLPGSVDLQDEPIYENRVITVRFTYPFATPQEMQAKKRDVAQWLSGRAKLIFDDEPQLFYDAKVFEAIAIEQSFHVMAIEVLFECAPYAYGREIHVPITNGKTKIEYEGNAKTPTLIILRNEGTLNVVNINITQVVRVTGGGTV